MTSKDFYIKTVQTVSKPQKALGGEQIIDIQVFCMSESTVTFNQILTQRSNSEYYMDPGNDKDDKC